MRTLAIDWGRRRIGLAISDAGGRLATPLQVLEVASASAAIDAVCRAVAREPVARLLVGLPLNMDDTVGGSAREAIAFAEALSSRLALPLVYVDERLSSFDAEQRLIEQQRAGRRLTRDDKRRRLDSLAAAALLQAFLDGRLPPLPPPARAPLSPP